MNGPTLSFCGECGGKLMNQVIAAELRSRRLCSRCGAITYSNPKVLVTTIVASDDRVLLCRRADPPAAGRWALPGGFMESGETLEEAAARETREETGVRLEPRELNLYGLGTLPEISQVYVGFVATLIGPANLRVNSECTEVRFFNEQDLPWSKLAYTEIGVYLRKYFAELRNGALIFHYGSINSVRVVSKAYRIADVETFTHARICIED
jgi:ADP-ribose pyrophosphatase YjhB (NUDIX family)